MHTLTVAVKIYCIVAVFAQDYEEYGNEEPEATTAASTAATTPRVNATTFNPVHVNNQVNSILSNVDNFNITGIVDSALGIRNDVPVRNLVNGILSTVFCNNFFANFNNCGPPRRNRGYADRQLNPKFMPLKSALDVATSKK